MHVVFADFGIKTGERDDSHSKSALSYVDVKRRHYYSTAIITQVTIAVVIRVIYLLFIECNMYLIVTTRWHFQKQTIFTHIKELKN